jgi:putative membrane protein
MFSQIYLSVIWTPVWAHMDDDWDHMSDHMGDGAWGFMALWALFSVLIVALVVWAVWSVARRGSVRSTPNQAVAVLDERFARGELSPEEYQERRDVLEKR